jgi:HAD superfamily hydrolase (TIGR01549 family)
MTMIAILDIDGTLVDTNYQHAIAWYQAFRQSGIVVPVWRIHRHVGMGGDQIIEALCGAETEEDLGDDIRTAERALFMSMIEAVEPLPEARALIEKFVDKGHEVVLASSAKEDEVDHYLELLDARDLVSAWTTSADVKETKPAPDLVTAALEKANDSTSLLIGDTPWDVQAARRAGVGTVAVLTGGFSEAELRDAGAIGVYDSLQSLIDDFDWIVGSRGGAVTGGALD